MSDYRDGLRLIPAHMRPCVTEYIERGLPSGGFLMSLLRGELHAWNRADSANQAALADGSWQQFLNMYAPSECHGSPEKVAAWVDGGGLNPRAPQPSGSGGLPKIFVFINSGHGTEWISGVALAEDGHSLAGHVSSHEMWFRHDMGLTSTWKHDLYKAHYPNGYELVEVDARQPHEGLDAAVAKNQARAAEKETVTPEREEVGQ